MRAVKAKRLRRIRKAWVELGYTLRLYSDEEILAPGFGCYGAFDSSKLRKIPVPTMGHLWLAELQSKRGE